MTEGFTPVFGFDGDLPSQEDFDNILDSANGGGGSVLRPGTYNLTVKEVIPVKKAADPAWFSARIVLAGSGDTEGKEVSLFLLVPATNKLTYTKNGKDGGFPLLNFMETMGKLGITVNRENIRDIVLQYFSPSNLGAMVGRTVEATIGYTRAYAKRIGEGDDAYITLIDDGNILKSPNGEPYKFTGDEAYTLAAEKAKELGIAYQSFPEVIGLNLVEVAGGEVVNSNW